MPMDLQWIAPLAASGAGALLQAATADLWQRARVWEHTRAGFARLLGRGDPQFTERVAAELDAQASHLWAAGPGVRPAIEGELLAGWQARLAELLAAHPDAAGELRGMVSQVEAELAGYVQHNTAKDGGTIYAVQGGDQIIHRPGGTG